MKKEEVRISFRVKGPKLAQLREVQDLMAFDTLTEAHQYLAQRGMEVLGQQLVLRKVMKEALGKWSPDEMMPLLAPLMGEGGPTLKPAEKVP